MQPLFDNLTVIKDQFVPEVPIFVVSTIAQKSNQLVIGKTWHSFAAAAFLKHTASLMSTRTWRLTKSKPSSPEQAKVQRWSHGRYSTDRLAVFDAQSNGLAYMVDKTERSRYFAHVNLVKGERSQLSEFGFRSLWLTINNIKRHVPMACLFRL